MNMEFRTEVVVLPTPIQRLLRLRSAWVEINYSYDADDPVLIVDDVRYRGLSLGIVRWSAEFREGEPYTEPCPVGTRQCLDLEVSVVERLGALGFGFTHTLLRFRRTICTDC